MRTPARPFDRDQTYTSVVPTHDLHVWFRATDSLDDAAIAAAASVLSDEEREQYHRFHFARDARDYAAAHALLRHTLSLSGDRTPAEWQFEKTHAGKPLLIGDSGDRASFSLSHTRGMVACAVTAGAEVGVDVECVDRDVDGDEIAARFFAPVETVQLIDLKGDVRRDRFFDLWTLKEALVKALGRGMAVSLRSLAFTVGAGGDIRLDAPDLDAGAWQFALFAPSPRHRLAVAAARVPSNPAQIIFRSLPCLG
jgi:4'-phosphopantetheinyl transferase